MEKKLNSIEEVLPDFKAGKVVIVVDDEDRENEGDFVAAGETMTAETINFMARYGRGLICAPLTAERAAELELEMMVKDNTSLHETPFTISIDLLGNGCTTGISASDRAKTIVAMADENSKPSDFGRPGHIFPLRARKGGVLERVGHTEACVDLCKLNGMKPVAALVEIMNEDGTMARLPQLFEIAEKFNLKITSVKALIEYRLKTETLVKREEEVTMPTEFGDFRLIAFTQLTNDLPHLALVKGDITTPEPVLVRVHSSCVTGDIFGSYKCDCGPQLHRSMQMIEKEGRGVVLYMNQEGRGIGLINKLKAYHLQEMGRDTVEANLELGFKDDERDYGVGAQILRQLGISKMKLITNNPVKRVGLESYHLEITETIPLIIEPNSFNAFYLETKRNKMGHNLNTEKHEE
ncbi:MAG: bifunctional 3,4-dihydroxy-2-butanone-4-phosphate synthase/GTP cyclohydrolase II [Bacteroidetes bacterium HGW-Bacteroidetes-6]|jgi:3,4-dihydroxy 2-butanone 4-phosphate synthase/GTP cyclohydrolase II|nr:MAG: bifunctional 3,4-dihydroxy-2-butanone-4-phosphate synthase/GTP cyclohydrolase II [Bacteroidetes bacterium HGW-Bacteroidetes-6]